MNEYWIVGLPLWSNLLWHIINKPRVVAQLWPNVFLDEFFPGFNAYSFKRSNNICVRKTIQVSSHQGIRTYSREIPRSWIIGTRKKDVVLHLHERVIPTPSPFNHCLSASTVNRRGLTFGPNTHTERGRTKRFRSNQKYPREDVVHCSSPLWLYFISLGGCSR